MTPEQIRDRAQEAKRVLDHPLVREHLAGIETDAIDAMLEAQTDEARRELRDTVRTIRKLRALLHSDMASHQEAARPRPGIA